MNFFEVLQLGGIVAAVWMLLGVLHVARRFPGYSHTQQVMSELGAKGRPTTRVHPWVNNFPIAVLFIAFGLAVSSHFWGDIVAVSSGVLIVMHGVSHAIAGACPCDENLGMPKASLTQVVHNIAGVMMFTSLLAAGVIWSLAPARSLGGWFRWFSLASCIVAVVFFLLMVRSFYTGVNVGLYQRISYGALVLWSAVFSAAVHLYG